MTILNSQFLTDIILHSLPIAYNLFSAIQILSDKNTMVLLKLKIGTDAVIITSETKIYDLTDECNKFFYFVTLSDPIHKVN